MAGIFAPKSCRVLMYLLLHAGTPVSQKQVAQATRVSRGLASRVFLGLVERGLVKRPYRTRFSLEEPNRLLVEWAGNRRLSSAKAYFARDAGILRRLQPPYSPSTV